jgi:hypothetical protein
MSERINQEIDNCEYKEAGSLREEVMQSQQARIDLLKYKLVAIAALGSIGLGFNAFQVSNFRIEPDYVLCIIPFVCIYVDLLCWHNNLRILVIGRFLDYHNDSYENYLSIMGQSTPRKGAGYFFELEDFALHWSSIMVSLLLFLYGCYFSRTQQPTVQGYAFIVVGLAGITVSIVIQKSYTKHLDTLFKIAKDLKCTRDENNDRAPES